MKKRLDTVFDFYMLAPKDELRNGSTEFFMFFKKFCNEAESSCPKVEKKRAGANKGGAPGKAAPPSFQAELMAKLAAQGKKN